jgi:hypothetical protein
MLGRNFESTSQIVPERHTVLGAGLGQAEESIAAIAPGIAGGSGLRLCDCGSGRAQTQLDRLARSTSIAHARSSCPPMRRPRIEIRPSCR